MKIYGYTLNNRPTTGDVGDIFIDMSTYRKYVFDDGQWQEFPGGPVVPAEYVKNTDYATDTKTGVVKVGSGLAVSESGVLSVTFPEPELPAVTSEDVGKVLTVNADGEWAAVLPE